MQYYYNVRTSSVVSMSKSKADELKDEIFLISRDDAMLVNTAIEKQLPLVIRNNKITVGDTPIPVNKKLGYQRDADSGLWTSVIVDKDISEVTKLIARRRQRLETESFYEVTGHGKIPTDDKSLASLLYIDYCHRNGITEPDDERMFKYSDTGHVLTANVKLSEAFVTIGKFRQALFDKEGELVQEAKSGLAIKLDSLNSTQEVLKDDQPTT